MSLLYINSPRFVSLRPENNWIQWKPSHNENPLLPANFANTADFITDLKRQLFSLKNTLSELENLELQKAKN